jgi:phosphoserine aminotransferase
MNSLNFSGGPGVLPVTVLAETQQAISMLPEVGLSILGISHRSDWFVAVVAEAERNIRELLKLPDNYAVIFLQGGASLQFSMIPMLLLRGSGKTAEYLRTGYWSSKAIPEAAHEGNVRVIWDGEANGFRRLPTSDELSCSADAAYLHYVSNETVEGTQFHAIPGIDGVPRVCDMSSDFLSRPFDPNRSHLRPRAKKSGPGGRHRCHYSPRTVERCAGRTPRISRLPLTSQGTFHLQHTTSICHLRGYAGHPLAIA